ncbi:hypothetical protein H8356DRAFT_1361393 [Neocallimastix lanati (nom. inval.)]|nr:hypothetical protein H8356DRAFT_1361393 [Neocallimastix sp. JGI-2020a]
MSLNINVKDIYHKLLIITAIYVSIDTFPNTVKYLLRTPNVFNLNERNPNGDYPLL